MLLLLAFSLSAGRLLGDISNLIGCILTGQLPFQKWLATYFVLVDLTLVGQYVYYSRNPKTMPSTFAHVRSATTPSIPRRMSLDRGASRYRTLSAVAANVAQAAALAAQQDERADARTARGRHRHTMYEESSRVQPQDDDDIDDSALAALTDSFHSEGGRDIRGKRVSWSIERYGGRRGSSVGRQAGITRPTRPAALHLTSDETISSSDRGRSIQRHDLPDVEEAATSLSSSGRRDSRASRRSATTMVFLGAWALFGIGTLAGSKRGLPSTTTTNIGRVLTPKAWRSSELISVTTIPFPKPSSSDGYASVQFKSFDLDDAPLSEPPQDGDDISRRVVGRILPGSFVRKSVEGLSMYLFIFAFLGNTFYVASILLSPKVFEPPPVSTEFIAESIPYLLGSGGTLLFDVTIVAQSFIYRPRHRRHLLTHSRLVEEESGLLAGDVLSAHPPLTTGESAISPRGRTSRTRGSD
ncbi:hypothetical protein BDQ17DRAFT_1418849 [Cyathus striatus]|nr:hypothetical protein BDQ17DRAFT_1418849 [Cyathus striatus]